MKGFRGLTTILGSWVLILGDTFFSQISGINPSELKVAFVTSLPITLKLIWTDARPKIMGMFSGN